MSNAYFKTAVCIVAVVISLFAVAGSVTAQAPPPPPGPPASSILNTKHNLSISGPGTIKSTTEERVCVFCHAPHNVRRDIPYLWNRQDSTANYIPYQSTTLFASVDQPTGSSKLCLSCHDGTIALGATQSLWYEIPFAGGIRFIPEGPSKIGTDLSDDHPVSFVYDSGLVSARGELADPSTLPPEIKLDSSDQMQCTTCHDPHTNKHGQFLVMPNTFSDLCNSCHNKDGWTVTSHALSNAVWNGNGTDPWPHTSSTTVAENACENCHRPHSAGRHERILNYYFEEDNCIACHNGNVAVDIEQELTKPYGHAVHNYVDIHDPAEDFSIIGVTDHVECSDCHNSHWSNSNVSSGAPLVSGINEGVTGINSAGQQIEPAANLYEICYKCHSLNNVIDTVTIDRQLQQLDVSLEFDPLNPSYHPVETQGVNPNVPSLLPPYSTSSIIFCTDCHNNDDTAGPKGPHGSFNQFILEENYTTQDFTQESSYAYALCYKCHDRSSILNNASFPQHSLHIVDNSTPCSACHDAHGISGTQGSVLNNSHLINFDIVIVQPNSQSQLNYEDLGSLSGRCFLSCHGVDHNPKVYP